MSLGVEAPSRGVALTLHAGKNSQGFYMYMKCLGVESGYLGDSPLGGRNPT